MKTTTKRKIFSIIFIALCAIVLVVTGLLAALRRWSTLQGDFVRVERSEVVEMCLNETLDFTDIHPDFEKLVAEDGNGYRFSKQTAQRLSYTSNEEKEYWSPHGGVYVDSEGAVRATKTGVYQLEYAVTRITSDGSKGFDLIHSPSEIVFSATIAVYADEYLPFPTSASSFFKTENYQLTQDVTWKYSEWVKYGSRDFEGTIVNPNGYTLTIETDEEIFYYPSVGGLFKNCHGIVDGLKVKYVSTEKAPFTSQIFALSEESSGYFKNCSVTGELYVTGEVWGEYGGDGAYVSLIPTGIAVGNTVDVSVYCDGEIYPYDFKNRANPKQVKKMTDNTVKIDAYYYSNNVGSRRRDIARTMLGVSTADEYVYEDENNNRFVPAYPQIGKVDLCMVHIETTRLSGAYGYELRVGAPLEVPADLWNHILGTNYSSDDPEIVFKKWTVNGEDRSTLDGLTVKKGMRLVAHAEYTDTGREVQTVTADGTYYRLAKLYNADDVLNVNDPEWDVDSGITIDEDLFKDFFENPFNKIPEKIVIDKKVKFKWRFMGLGQPFSPDSVIALQEYLQGGGKLEVESGNTELTLIQNKMLCSADGKTLYHYFPENGEKEIALHPQIKQVLWNSFVGGENYLSLDLSSVEEFDMRALRGCPNVEKIAFGENVLVKEWVTWTSTYDRTLRELLSYVPKLRSLTIDEHNTMYHAKNGFVIEKSSDTLVYALPTFTGTVNVPSEVLRLGDGAFMGSDIEELVFSSSMAYFNEYALSGMEKLKKIQFNATWLTSVLGKREGVELPTLTEIVFSDSTTYLDFSYNCFENAKLGKVVLPKNLSTVSSMFNSCEGFVYEGENAAIEVDAAGAFYISGKLVAYPAYASETEYTVVGTEIGEYAFYNNAALKNVTLEESVSVVGKYAFEGTAIERVVCKAAENISVGAGAFSSCASLVAFELEKKTATVDVGWYAFTHAENLKKFPSEQATSIGGFSFANTALENFVCRESVTVIPTGAFSQCKQLKSVTLNGVTVIEKSAFLECESLKRIESAKVVTIGESAFTESGLLVVTFPLLDEIPARAFAGCKALITATFAKTASVGESAFQDCSAFVEFNVDEVSYIGASGFENCSLLERIAIVGKQSTGEVFVGQNAFNGCVGLKKVEITGVSMQICENAFSGCDALEEVTVQAETGVIETGAFSEGSCKVYLNVSSEFQWNGAVPKGFTLYVPDALIEKFGAEWLIEKEQFIPYEF